MENKDPHPLIAATLMAFLCFGMVTFFVMLFASCDTCKRKETHEVSVLHDWTETQIARPIADEIIPLFGLDSNKWKAAEFRYGYFTDVSFNRYTTISLTDGGSRLLSSGFTRDKEIARFTDSIRTFLASLSADTVGRPHSSIYLPLVAELTRLAESATTRVLLVYSDLMENQDISFYDKRTFRTLQTNPDEIAAELVEKAPLPSDLTGIQIYLIFQPADAHEDQVFQVVSGFYKTLLESRGASVTISANVTAPITEK